MTVGERMKLLREQKGLSQDELAKMMGYAGKTSISKIESSGNNMTTKTVSKFAKALGCTEAYLMGWEEIDLSVEQAMKDAELTNMDISTKEIVEKFNRLSKEDQKLALSYISYLEQKGE